MKYDAVGNMLKKGTTVFTWNQGRMLATVDNGKKISYGYDHTRESSTKNGRRSNYGLLYGRRSSCSQKQAGIKLSGINMILQQI